MTEAIKNRNKKVSKMIKKEKDELEDYNLSESEEEQP